MNEELKRTKNSRGLIPYGELQKAVEALTSIIVLVCPDENCSRTATIEVSEAGEEVVRYHSDGKNDPLTSLMDSLGRASYVRCPEHDEVDAMHALGSLNITVDPCDNRPPREILDSLRRQEVKSMVAPILPKTLSRL